MNRKILISTVVLSIALLTGGWLWYSSGKDPFSVASASDLETAVNQEESASFFASASNGSRATPTAKPASVALNRIYGANTIAAQQSIASGAVGDARFDAELLVHHADRMCNYLAETSAGDFATAARGSARYPQDDAALASYRLVDLFRKSYCNSGTDSRAVRNPDATPLSLLAAEEQGSEHAKKVLEVWAAIEAETASQNAAKLKESLVEVLRNADSPGLISEAMMLMTTPEFGGFMPAGFDAGGLDENQELRVAQFGSMLASCGAFDLCGSRTAYSLRACMPHSCRGNGSLDDYVRGALSPTEYQAARRYAEALLAFRR